MAISVFPTIDAAQIVIGLTQLMQIIFTLVIIGAITFIAVKRKWFVKFPTTALIFRMRGEKMFLVDEDKARRVKNKKDGEIYYEFRKRHGLKWKPPSFEFLAATTKNKSVMFLKELGQDDFEIIDPKTFIASNPEEYRKVENEELDKFYKNIQDDRAKIKWKLENKWQKLIDALPILMTLMGVVLFLYIFGNYVAVPLIQQYSGIAGQAVQINDQSQALLDKSTQYIDTLIRSQELNNNQQIAIQYVCYDGTIRANRTECPVLNTTP